MEKPPHWTDEQWQAYCDRFRGGENEVRDLHMTFMQIRLLDETPHPLGLE